jgi:alpha-amylase/alpha-mannosidase (GH57 family)
MKKILLTIFSGLLIAVFVLSACAAPTVAPTLAPTAPLATEAPAADEDVLYLNLTWHQHQPLYYKDAGGVYTRPWVRVHATKDYYDMAAMVKPYENVRVTINLTPVLIKQLDDFTENGAIDYYWLLAEKPANELTEDEKEFILTRFFDANWDNIIGRFPRYKQLLNLRGGTSSEDIVAAAASFSEQDLRDLQIWFNLAWIDPEFLAQSPLQELVEKGEGFSEEDKVILFDEIRRIMAQVIPLHKEMQDSGQIQVITTPYAHPILPLIYNTDIAAVGNPAAELPERFSYPNDAIAHLKKSVEIYTDHFGQAPVGLWPGEGSVSEDIVPLVAKAGYQFMQTGESVLAESLGIGSFTRNSAETVQESDALYRPYYVVAPGGEKVAIFFRDLTISDKLGFTYSQTPGEQAAADLMQRLENIRLRLKEEGAKGPHIVSIVLDGENAWEYYPNDGKEFLNAMYRMLNESETIKMVTPSEYLELFPEQRELDYLFPGAWFSPNYDTWIGESEETAGWNYLGKVRSFLAKFDIEKSRTAPSPEALEQALDYMYLAEGSDWFWWYGADQDSGVDEYFDTGFRALLAKVYESLGEPVPIFVNVPIIPKKPAQPAQAYSGSGTPVVDGVATDEEWATSAVYPVENVPGIASFAYTMDSKAVYFKLALDGTEIVPTSGGVYLKIPSAEASYPFALTPESPDSLLLGISASHLFAWGEGSVTGYTAANDGWKANPALVGAYAAGATDIEFSVPLTSLGELAAGDDVRVVAVTQPGGYILPFNGPAQIVLPDLGLSDIVLEVLDPANDDHGPGTYTYPTDAVFSAQNFDIESFTVSTDVANVIFTFKFYGDVPNPWGSGSNLSLQTLDVYIDKDPGQGTGNRMLLPGRNAALSSGNGWEYMVWAEGWTPGIFAPDPESGEPKAVNLSYKLIVNPAQKSVTLRVPREAFGDGDPAEWGYAAVVLSQDGYPATGVWRVRDIQSNNAQWKFGGAPNDVNHTRIIDLAWPADGAGTQEEMLAGYPSSDGPLDTLTPDDFAQISLLLIK